MDGAKGATNTAAPGGATENLRSGRRRRWQMGVENVRYFLPKTGASAEKPELGQEIPSEGEVLVKAFKDGGVFYTLVAWNAATEITEDGPKIIKQALKR